MKFKFNCKTKIYVVSYGFLLKLTVLFTSCNDHTDTIKPLFITERVPFDSDDPAIWINLKNPAQSLVIGTDKGDENGMGGLYVFDLQGRMIEEKCVRNLHRPNNVDVAYGFKFLGSNIDIAACTERNKNRIRIFRLPEMVPIDGGGIEVFQGEQDRSPMGIALYKDSKTSEIFAIVSRKSGPKEGYLAQYLLSEGREGYASGVLVRKFGKFEGNKEIEAIAVDNELGYVYYSDEGLGIRKYYAHPDSGNQELAVFAKSDVKEDHEGISIYKTDQSTGYILLSDQQTDEFNIYPREGAYNEPHVHKLIKKVKLETSESDGNEVVSNSILPHFPNGLFVAMSTDGTFHYYSWNQISRGILKSNINK